MRYFVTILLVSMIGCSTVRYVPEADETNEAMRLIDQGVVLMRQGSFDSARASFQVAKELGLTAPALDGLGCVCLLEQDFVGAERNFRAALATDPDYAYAIGNLAMLYEIQGKKDAAYELYQKALDLQPKEFRLRNNYAAFMADFRQKSDNRIIAASEMLKAKMVMPHPIIEKNLNTISLMDEDGYGTSEEKN